MLVPGGVYIHSVFEHEWLQVGEHRGLHRTRGLLPWPGRCELASALCRHRH